MCESIHHSGPMPRRGRMRQYAVKSSESASRQEREDKRKAIRNTEWINKEQRARKKGEKETKRNAQERNATKK